METPFSVTQFAIVRIPPGSHLQSPFTFTLASGAGRKLLKAAPDVNTPLSRAKAAVPLQKLLNIITDPGISISGVGNLISI